MQLPYTSNNLMYWMDPSEKYITTNSSNQVVSVFNRATRSIMTPTPGSEPLWVNNVIAGRPVLRFNNGQNLVANFPQIASSIGARIPFMMTCVAKITTFGGAGNIMMSAGSQTNPPLCSQILQVGDLGSGPVIIYQKQADTGSAVLSAFDIAADSNFHIYSNIYDGTNLTYRRDGRVINSISATSLNNLRSSINQICLGDWTPPQVISTGHSYFIGDIAMAVVYMGDVTTSIDYSYEEYLKDTFNL